MIIGVAGLYSATESEKKENTAAMNKAAALLCSIGHIPMIGINTAVIPYLENNVCSYNAILQISLAAIDRCEDLLLLAESLGTNKERELILSKALPVFCSIEEVGARTTSPNQKISKNNKYDKIRHRRLRAYRTQTCSAYTCQSGNGTGGSVRYQS